MIRDVGYVLLVLAAGATVATSLVGVALKFAPENALGLVSAIIVPVVTVALFMYCMISEIGEVLGWASTDPPGSAVEGRVVGLGEHVEFPPHDWRSPTCVLAVSTRLGGGGPLAVPFAIRTRDTVFHVCVGAESLRRLRRYGSVRPSIGMQWLRPRLGLAATPRHSGDVAGWMCLHEGDMVVFWSGLRVREGALGEAVPADARAMGSVYRAGQVAWYQPIEVAALGDGPPSIPVGIGSLRDQLVDRAVSLPVTWWMIRWWLPFSAMICAPTLIEIVRASWLASPLVPIIGAIVVVALARFAALRLFAAVGRRVAQICADVSAPEIPVEPDALVEHDPGGKPTRQWLLVEWIVRMFSKRRGRRLVGRGAAALALVGFCGWAVSAYGFIPLVYATGGAALVAFVYVCVAPRPPTPGYEPQTTRAGVSAIDGVENSPASASSGASRHVDPEPPAAPDPERPVP